MNRRIALTASLMIFAIGLYAQAGGQTEDYQIHLKKASSPITLDGALDEPAWRAAARVEDFYQNFPFDTSYAKAKTEVSLTFDDNFLYVGAIVFQPQENYIITSLKRDFSQNNSDEFAVNIDPFQDKTTGFHFAVTPFNVRREGLINDGNTISTDWDNKWYSEVGNHVDYWVVEMAIPFKTLRYKRAKGTNNWRINFSRNAVKENERSSWVPVPRQFNANTVAFSGLLVWEQGPPKPGLNVSLIPYATARTERDFEFKLPNELGADAGGDAKIAITPSLNLDLTFNPDFSQVEVDRQLTNLSRFELFFPERRQFFLENEDLFSRFGFPDARPFFSRRIGLARGTLERRTTEGQLIEVERSVDVPIIAGARLSGKLDNNWRLGLLNMQTAKSGDIGLGPANFSVGVLQRKVQERSYVGAVIVNKEIFTDNGDGGYDWDRDNYNRVVGLEYNFFSKDNKWQSEVYYHRSISPENNEDAQSAAVFMGYFSRDWSVFMPTQYIGENFRADAGFVPRNGVLSVSPRLTRNFFPRSEKVISYGFQFGTELVYRTPENYLLADRNFNPSLFVEFPGQSRLSAEFNNTYTYLFFPFDPTNLGGEELPANKGYTYNSFGLEFNSDVRRDFYFEAEASSGGFFNGDITRAGGAINYRWQPYGILALSFAYNDIRLPEPYNSADFWLVGPRAELSFSRSLFFSTFLQYNTQANNVNINSRLQWRFKPVSDVFLVYTDNYFSNAFFSGPQVKNRALVLKVTYWLNL